MAIRTHLTDDERGEALEILSLFMKCRWDYKGYGKLVCHSCGAEASEDHDTGKVTRNTPCSPVCPLALAEAFISRYKV